MPKKTSARQSLHTAPRTTRSNNSTAESANLQRSGGKQQVAKVSGSTKVSVKTKAALSLAKPYAWLVKSEPHVFSIEDLKRAKKQTTCWDGVRNYQARNMLRDQMQLGDRVLFYHSNTERPAIAGTARVVRAGYPDTTAFDPKDPHYDPKSDPSNPRWYRVDIQLERIFSRPLTLEELRCVPDLNGMELLRRGSRLSVQPVRQTEWATILRLAGAEDLD